jgi:hypothetical protein
LYFPKPISPPAFIADGTAKTNEKEHWKICGIGKEKAKKGGENAETVKGMENDGFVPLFQTQ